MKQNKIEIYVGLVLGTIAAIAFYSGIVTICIALAVLGFNVSTLLGGIALVIDSAIIYYLYKAIQ